MNEKDWKNETAKNIQCVRVCIDQIDEYALAMQKVGLNPMASRILKLNETMRGMMDELWSLTADPPSFEDTLRMNILSNFANQKDNVIEGYVRIKCPECKNYFEVKAPKNSTDEYVKTICIYCKRQVYAKKE